MTNDALHWYVGLIRPCQERKSAETLAKLGVEYFLPVQRVKRKYSDRIKEVDQLILPRMLFIRTDERRRIRLLSDIYGLRGYMNAGGTYRPVIVPDRQMTDFRFMVEHGEGKVRVSSTKFSPGDHVKLIDGPLKGLECELVSVDSKRCLAVFLGSVGTALLEVSPADLALLDKKD